MGYPVEFKKLCKVYPPYIKDVVGLEKFGMYTRILTFSQQQIEDELVKQNPDIEKFPTPFEFLLINSYHSSEYYDFAREAFKFFTHEEVTFLFDTKSILFGDIKEEISKIQDPSDFRILNEENFFDFQNLIRLSLNEPIPEIEDPDEDPRVKKMKAKNRYREKIKAKNAAKNGASFLDSLDAICCMDLGINPLNIGEITYVAMHELMETYQRKEKYELDMSSLLAGADSKKIHPKYWIGKQNK